MSARGPIGLRRFARVGDAPAAPAPAAPVPVGFAQVFKGWNVWDVWASLEPVDDLLDSILKAGLDLDREVRIWIENQIKDNAPGTAVADPLNPAALRGAQIQILPNANGLQPAMSRAAIPDLGGAVQLGKQGSAVKRYTVRFYNRGEAAVMPWAADRNNLLDVVYQPSSSNPITSAPAPSSLGGTGTEITEAVGTAVKAIAIGGGVVLAVVLVIALANNTKRAAA